MFSSASDHRHFSHSIPNPKSILHTALDNGEGMDTLDNEFLIVEHKTNHRTDLRNPNFSVIF